MVQDGFIVKFIQNSLEAEKTINLLPFGLLDSRVREGREGGQ